MNRIVIKPHGSKERSEENADEAARFDAKWELPKKDGERVSFSLRKAEPAQVAPRASWLCLGFWLGSFSVLWAALFFVVPAFEKMFSECGLCLPTITEAVIYASHFARSPLGVLAAMALLITSGKLRGRSRLLLAGAVLSVLLIALLVVGVFSPAMPGLLQKL